MGELSSYAKRNSKFVQLKDGESFQGIYNGFKIAMNDLEPDKEIVIYEVLDDERNKKFWKTADVAVASYFDDKVSGHPFTVTRRGKGRDTRYEFKGVESTQTTDGNNLPVIDVADDEIPF